MHFINHNSSKLSASQEHSTIYKVITYNSGPWDIQQDAAFVHILKTIQTSATVTHAYNYGIAKLTSAIK